MISFRKIEDFYKSGAESMTDEQKTALDYARNMSEYVQEVCACFAHGCLLLRVLDGVDADYYFPYPEAVADEFDIDAALLEISRYAVREGVPQIITEVYAEDLTRVIRGVRHANIDAMDNEANLYTVSIKTECMLIDAVPDINEGRVYIGELCTAYAADYADLCSDENVNRYFGYDYREDMPNASGDDLIREAEREFSLGIAVNFAATVLSDMGDNVFVGDGALYSFDGRGGAHVCFRLLPRWQGVGLGAELFSALVSAARSLGLVKLYAEVMTDNLPSAGLLSGRMTELSCVDNVINYSLDL